MRARGLCLVLVGAAGCDVLFGVEPGGGGGGGDGGRADGAATIDTDGDAVFDDVDNCVATANPDQADEDGDDAGDVCDSCPHVPTTAQADSDGDTVGDECDPDKQVPGSRWYVFEGFTALPVIDCPNMGSGNPAQGWACIRTNTLSRPMVSAGVLGLSSSVPSELGVARSDGAVSVQRIDAVLEVAGPPADTKPSWAYAQTQFDEDADGSSIGVARCGVTVNAGEMSAFFEVIGEDGVPSMEMLPDVTPPLTVRLDANAEGLGCVVAGQVFEVWSGPTARATSVGVFVKTWAIHVPYLAAVAAAP